MRLSLAICFAIFGHLTSAAPFWKEEPCPLLNDEISKSFNEAKQNCSLADLKGSEKVLCQKLEENFKELCQSGKKGNAKLDIKVIFWVIHNLCTRLRLIFLNLKLH